MIDAIARWLILSWGVRRAFAALACGAVSALAMPPYSLGPILLLTLPALAWLIEGLASEPLRGRVLKGFALGWVFGLGFHLAGLYWVGHAILVEAEDFAWVLPFAIIGLPAGLAVFTGVGIALASAFWPSNAARILALAGGLALADMLRGYALTGFPWNSLGYASMFSDILLQGASLVGLYGLSFAVVVVAALPAALWPREDGFNWLKPVVATFSLMLLALWLGYGWNRLEHAVTENEEGILIRIVQPNIVQTEKWKPENRVEIITTYLELTDRATSPEIMGASDVTHVIWPESSMPFFLLEAPAILSQLAALLPDDVHLLAGNIRRDETGFYNSLILFDGQARPLAAYDKQQLVPFGEYLPFSDLLTSIGLEQVSQIKAGFTQGGGERWMQVPGLGDVLPLICYEAIFPRLTATKGLRPRAMVNITNDGWFSFSSGPYQHFAQARMRAAEQGIPMVRAANTGISAVIDPYGRVIEFLPLGARGVIDSPLPKTLAFTTFARFHHLPALVMIILSFFVSMGFFCRQVWRSNRN